MRFLVGVFLSLVFYSCNLVDPKPESLRLSGYTLKFDTDQQLNIFTNKYIYDEENKLIRFIEYDTVFYHASKSFEPSQAITSYEYNNDGFLIKRTRETLSLVSNIESVIEYSYLDGRLLLEKTGTRLAEYQYDVAGRLKRVISSSLSNGTKTITDYDDDVPALWIKNANGFKSVEGATTTVYNQYLQPIKTETIDNGVLTYDKTNTYEECTHPFEFITPFKGFPKVRSIAYRAVIDKEYSIYRFVNGALKLSDMRTLSSTRNSRGLIVNSKGTEEVNLLNNTPTKRTVEYGFYYEKKD